MILILKLAALMAVLSWLMGLAIDWFIDRRQAKRDARFRAVMDEEIARMLAERRQAAHYIGNDAA